MDGLKRKVPSNQLSGVGRERTAYLRRADLLQPAQHLIETLLDRPLLLLLYINDKMYGRESLSEIARGAEEAGRWLNRGVGDQSNEQETSSGSIRVQVNEPVPRFTPEQVATEFDVIFTKLFPGEAVNEDDLEASPRSHTLISL